MTAKAESQCVLKHEWHSSRCAIRLLGMEKKKKEKDGEEKKKTLNVLLTMIKITAKPEINLKILKFDWIIS